MDVYIRVPAVFVRLSRIFRVTPFSIDMIRFSIYPSVYLSFFLSLVLSFLYAPMTCLFSW